MLKIVEASHCDHGLTEAHKAFLLEKYSEANGFFIETFELADSLGELDCALYGPIMGDAEVEGGFYEKRKGRDNVSRLVSRPLRPTRQITVIAGPHEKDSCVLFTAFGGPLAPKEVDDPTLNDEDRAASVKFWDAHALATGE